MTATLDAAAGDPQRTIAELQRQLDECRAELAARNSEFGERIEHQSATIDVLKAMSASPGDQQPVFDLIVRRARDLCNTATAAVFEFDGELVHFRSVVRDGSYGTPDTVEAYERQFPMVPTRGSITCRAILDRQTIHVRDLATVSGVSAAVRNLGVKSQISLPLLRDGAAIGAVVLTSAEIGGFTDSQVALLQTFAEQAVIAITSAETYRELQQRTGDLQESLEYQTATSDVLKVISGSSFDVQPVFETILETAARLCDADTATIRSREGEAFRVAATFAASPEYVAFQRGRLLTASRGTLAGRTAIEGRIVHIHDIASEPEYTDLQSATLGQFRTALGVPLLREGVVVGVITLRRQRVQPYTERQIELVRTFADQAVIALENARLLGELRERTDELAARNSEFGERIEHQSATIDVLKAMSASPGDPQPVFDLIVRRARDLCNTPSAGLFEFDGELVHRRSWVGTDAYGTAEAYEAYKRLFPMVPTRGSLTCRAILDRQIIHVRDIATEPGVSAAVRNVGHKSQISVPLLRDGAAIGAVVLSSGEIGGFTDSQVALLQTFAEQAVIAITSAETYRELQQRTGDLQESLEYQTATSDVLKVISGSTFDIQPVFETIAETATRLCDADGATIYNRGDDAYRMVATTGKTPEYEAVLRSRLFTPDRGMLMGRTALAGQVVHVHDLASDPEQTFTEAVTVGGVRTGLGVPLLREGVVGGVITITRRRVQPFTDRQIELVRTFADQAVIALENARLLGELQQRTDELAARNSEFGERIEHQSATIDVLKAMSASPGDPQPVFDLIVRRARDLCNGQGVGLFEFDGELVHARSVVRDEAYGTPDAREAYKRLFPMVPTRGSISCRAILDRQIVHVHDIATVSGVSADVRNLGYKSQIVLPLLRDGAAIGAVSLTSTEIGGFSDSQVALLQTFAEQAVIAVTSAETYRELQQRTGDLQESLEYQTATSDVLKVISQSGAELEPVLDALVETAARICDGESAFIFRLRDGLQHLAASFGFSPEYKDFIARNPIAPGHGTLVGRTSLELRTVHLEDAICFSLKGETRERVRAMTPIRAPSRSSGTPNIVRNWPRRCDSGQVYSRAGRDVRRASGDRDGERAALGRTAATHR